MTNLLISIAISILTNAPAPVEYPLAKTVQAELEHPRREGAVRSTEEILAAFKRQANYTNAVNLLVTSGELCKVRGHQWQAGDGQPLWANSIHWMQPTETRHCTICGKVESRSMPPWPAGDIESPPIPPIGSIMPNYSIPLTDWTSTNLLYQESVLTNKLMLDPSTMTWTNIQTQLNSQMLFDPTTMTYQAAVPVSAITNALGTNVIIYAPQDATWTNIIKTTTPPNNDPLP